ncbi:MAG: TonB-dependent receptor, partial [Bacteroidota bacterium]
MHFHFSALMRTLLSLFCLLFSFSVFAQTGSIRGQVKDANGQPLVGASVQLEGQRGGTVTDNNGFFSLSSATGRQTLIVSFVGQATQRIELNVTAQGVLQQDVTLQNSGDLSGITLTGSRNATRTRIETAVPVDVIPVAQVLSEIGQVDLNQIINYIAPSFQSARQAIADGTDHVDPGQLRGLGPDQVLVLINGKRRHQSALVNVNGTVNRGSVGTDLSAIPATAIERIEILRDGAAAQYGSDAIAGVINIILKKRTGLLEANLSYGMHKSSYDKNFPLFKLQNKTDDPSVNVTDGKSVQASLGYGFKLGAGYLTLTGEYIHRDPTNRTGTYTGAVYPNVNGVNRDDSILNGRGLNRNFFDMVVGQSEMSSKGLFYNFGYPIGTKTELYLFGGYNQKEGVAAGFYRYPSGIPGAARQYQTNAFAIYPNGFLPRINSDLKDISTAVGLRTKFGGWNFDISNTYGRNKFDFIIDNSVNYTQFAVAGNNQTEFDAGGLTFWQNTVNADLSKKFDVLAGLNVATGAEYRIDAFGIRSGEEASYKNYDVASAAASGAQVFAGFINTIGETQTRNAKAAYLDMELDVTKKFLITGAGRFENYSDFGSTFNYKFSTRYKFSDG